MNNKAIVICISIETHNAEDYYYKEYYDKYFISFMSEEETFKILKNIIPKEYVNKNRYSSCMQIKDIDYESIKQELIKNEIFPLEPSLTWTYYLKDDE